MRDIPTELTARIESGAATLCHAWIVVRTDGARMGFTDHDRDLEVDGVVCAAGSGWTQGAMDASAGLGAGSLAVQTPQAVQDAQPSPARTLAEIKSAARTRRVEGTAIRALRHGV